MKTESDKKDNQEMKSRVDLEIIYRQQIEINKKLDMILEKLGMTKPPCRPVDPSRISLEQHDPDGLETTRLEDADLG